VPVAARGPVPSADTAGGHRLPPHTAVGRPGPGSSAGWWDASWSDGRWWVLGLVVRGVGGWGRPQRGGRFHRRRHGRLRGHRGLRLRGGFRRCGRLRGGCGRGGGHRGRRQVGVRGWVAAGPPPGSPPAGCSIANRILTGGGLGPGGDRERAGLGPGVADRSGAGQGGAVPEGPGHRAQLRGAWRACSPTARPTTAGFRDTPMTSSALRAGWRVRTASVDVDGSVTFGVATGISASPGFRGCAVEPSPPSNRVRYRGLGVPTGVPRRGRPGPRVPDWSVREPADPVRGCRNRTCAPPGSCRPVGSPRPLAAGVVVEDGRHPVAAVRRTEVPGVTPAAY
jgi:hypothetical protein